MKRKKLKILLLILLVLIVIGGITAASLASKMERELNALAAEEMKVIELSTLEDGSYEGKYKAFPIDVELTVNIADHAIQSIDLIKHFNGQGEAAEAILEDVVEAQSLQVDTISGATYSSKVILKAIEAALQP